MMYEGSMDDMMVASACLARCGGWSCAQDDSRFDSLRRQKRVSVDLFSPPSSAQHDDLRERWRRSISHFWFQLGVYVILGVSAWVVPVLFCEDTPLPWWLGSAFALALRSYFTAFAFSFRILA
ncbi:hypothetical protein DPSP01_011684 [Paraphaeosphaeria sporulosa]|uniref:Uncharacterized protein n=1 Tax=Paraphaeosphaeria sporulosa TaxID=1460663 RepID=A0A177CZB1_9PLEO|nr:uncharacterized protein CC84DRAFT_71819 [Paraphaeosphaeria sporulosa]OAG12180.1 hypothetical protein CC84DRAFT_71819 [Paraphaeosphaeria sporulosa]